LACLVAEDAWSQSVSGSSGRPVIDALYRLLARDAMLRAKARAPVSLVHLVHGSHNLITKTE
jgi:hypothetical protein